MQETAFQELWISKCFRGHASDLPIDVSPAFLRYSVCRPSSFLTLAPPLTEFKLQLTRLQTFVFDNPVYRGT